MHDLIVIDLTTVLFFVNREKEVVSCVQSPVKCTRDTITIVLINSSTSNVALLSKGSP